MTDCDELRAEVAHLRWRLDALERSFAQLARVRSALDPLDRDWLADLLPAIAEAVGDEAWTLCDLFALATIPGYESLTTVIAPHAGSLRGFGKALARVVDFPVGRFVLRRVGDSRGGALWQVRCEFVTRKADCVPCAVS